MDPICYEEGKFFVKPQTQLTQKLIYEINFLSLDVGKGGKAKWLGDGFCDDINNLAICKWDLGDYIQPLHTSLYVLTDVCITLYTFQYKFY